MKLSLHPTARLLLPHNASVYECATINERHVNKHDSEIKFMQIIFLLCRSSRFFSLSSSTHNFHVGVVAEASARINKGLFTVLRCIAM